MIRKLMNGRYGSDTLSLVIIFVAVIFFQFKYLWIIGAALAGYAFYRMLSKDTGRRFKEKQAFEGLIKRVVAKLYFYRTAFRQRNQYVFLKCEKCRNNLRLPKNKGKLEGTCPVCGFKFMRKT
ncbi:hypothetical protein DFR58_102211 [Anaerobacterium chartisolvens]|uniref:Zn-finger containing protein n=1 Tax=Anaerobacterium chartisolvens TaxID=1297424 RepID=A0A369BF23_9FIRM|nr:hypothetical protein [Anaerobacterium chartisolvens]RCX20139.1 hypothetical protein DFR58_102211 [Anaerobacterium chartisolvens]